MGKLFLLLVILLLLGSLYAAGKKPDCRCVPVSALSGIWRQATAEPLVGYLYFTEAGAVYFMASRVPATESMFTDKFKLTDSFSGGSFSAWEYTVQRGTDGRLLLVVSGEAIGGRYYKFR